MTEDEKETICKAIAVACMWGYGGIGSVILDNLEKRFGDRSWHKTFNEVADEAKRSSVGVLDDNDRLSRYLSSGYWLTNWNEKGCSLFNPPPMNGLCMYVSKRLADEYKARHDFLMSTTANR